MAIQLRSGTSTNLMFIDTDGSLKVQVTTALPQPARTPVIISGTSLAVATTETLLSLTAQKGVAAAGTAAGSYTITAGKKLRLQSIVLTQVGNATATAATSIIRLRYNATGAVTATSTPILFPARLAAGAVATSYTQIELAIPDGLELTGDGNASLGFTVTSTYTLNAPTVDILAIGYEY